VIDRQKVLDALVDITVVMVGQTKTLPKGAYCTFCQTMVGRDVSNPLIHRARCPLRMVQQLTESLLVVESPME